jgi:tRNA(fMet)-specific endonuclease VapC
MAGSPRKRRDLADIAGTWQADKAVEAALADRTGWTRISGGENCPRHESLRRSPPRVRRDRDAPEEAEAILLPCVVVGELRAGFAHGRRQAENERILRRFLLKDGMSVLFADDQTTHHYASVFRQLRKQGTPIPTNDMWLAALVLQHNLALHARDKALRSPAAKLSVREPSHKTRKTFDRSASIWAVGDQG